MCSLLFSPRKEMCPADCLLIDLSWGHRSLTLVCSQSDRGSRGTTARSSSDMSSNGGSPGHCGSKEGIAILGHQGRLPEEMPEQSCRKDKSFQGGVQLQTAACTPFFAQPHSEACHVPGKATGSEMNPTGVTRAPILAGEMDPESTPQTEMSKNGDHSDVGAHGTRRG